MFPFGIPLSNTDSLKVIVYNSRSGASLILTAWITDKNGKRLDPILLENYTPTSDKLENSKQFRNIFSNDTYLIGVSAISGGVRGQTYVLMQLTRRDGTRVLPLCQGYVSESNEVFWSPWASVVEDAISGRGYIHTVDLGDPSASAALTYTVPANTRIRIIGLSGTLTTDANVADRLVFARFDTQLQISAGVVQPASQVVRYVWGGGFSSVAIVGLAVNISIPEKIHLSAGQQIRIFYDNNQATDDFSRCYALVEEWIED